MILKIWIGVSIIACGGLFVWAGVSSGDWASSFIAAGLLYVFFFGFPTMFLVAEEENWRIQRKENVNAEQGKSP